MKSILFISYDGMTDPLGQSQVIPYLAGLVKCGYKITILSCEKPERYAALKKEVEGVLKLLPVNWSPILYHKNPPVLSTVYDVAALKKKARQLHEKENFDMVHTRPGIPALVGLWMKKKWGIKFLNDIREFYADSRVDGGIWNTNLFFYKVIYNFFKKKERRAVVECDGIVCLTHAAKKIILMWPYYKKEIPLKVIPCSVDMHLFDPLRINASRKSEIKKELGIKEGDCIFSYLGSIGSWYMVDEMMNFFKKINDKSPSAKFLFISPDQHETIFNRARKAGLPENKIIVRNAKRNEVPLLLSFSKYSVFFIKPCYSKQSSSPTKHGEIMAMGIPVITNFGVGDVAAIVERYHSGIVIHDLENKEFDDIAATVPELSFDKMAIRNAALDYYNLDNAVAVYKEIYSQILLEGAT